MARRAWGRANYVTNRDEVLAKTRVNYYANRERRLAQAVAWQRANPEKVRAAVRRYKQAHPETMAHINARRRVRKAGNGGTHTLKEWQDKRVLLGNVCFYCGEAKPLTRDHKVSIARGGTDDITNIVPACRSCNARKGTRSISEFLGLQVAA